VYIYIYIYIYLLLLNCFSYICCEFWQISWYDQQPPPPQDELWLTMAFFIWISPEVILTLITLTSSKTWLTSTLSIKLKIYSTDSAGYMFIYTADSAGYMFIVIQSVAGVLLITTITTNTTTLMRCMMTFQSMMDRIYDGCPIRL